MKILSLIAIAFVVAGCSQNSRALRAIYGEVEAEEIDVASRIPGRVKKVLVEPGTPVTAGTALVEFEDDVLAAKRDRAKATIAAAESQKKIADDAVRAEEKEQLKAAVAAAREQSKFASATLARAKVLVQEGAIARQQLEEIEFKANAALESLRAATARLRLAEKGARIEQKEGAQALVDQAKTALSEVQAYDKDLVLTAPTDGEVAQVLNHEGELVPTGYPVVTLLKVSKPWVTVRVPETLLAELPIGKKVKVRLPALKNQEFPATITHTASMAGFATRTFTQDRSAFDVKTFSLRVQFKDTPPGLRPGMTAVVSAEK